MMRLAGGDAVTYMYENAGSAVSQEVIDETRKEYGLDQPFLVQYAKWFAGMATGDMGKSYVSKRDVYETFIEKLPATILLNRIFRAADDACCNPAWYPFGSKAQ